MSFAHAWILHFLWLLPLAGICLIFSSRRQAHVLKKAADPELITRLIGKPRSGVRFIKGLLLLGALFLMIFALAGPRWGSRYQEVKQKGVDIMIAFDVSPSMLVSDIKPNRLERAKRKVQDLLHVIRGDRVGLVAFSGSAFVQCPLTLDYEALSMFLNQLEPRFIPVPGTDLGYAIVKAIDSFDSMSQADKVILLITDGEDNEGLGQKAAEKARIKGVKVFVLGIGETGGGPVPGPGVSFAKDESGRIILSRLDEEGLKEIASTTGGTYARVVTGDLDLDIIYFAGIKSHTRATEIKSGKIKVFEERFAVFIAAALLLLLIEVLLLERHPGPFR